MSDTLATSGTAATPESPWLGLRSFTEENRGYFFGRGDELNDLYERILDKPLAILFGQSGLGKSSLLQAALLPKLRSAGFLPVFVRFDHDAVAPRLERQLLDALRRALEFAGYESQAAGLREILSEAKPAADYAAVLWLLFHDPAHGFIPARGAAPDEFPRPVFLIDQFEEIFTLGERPNRRGAAAEFRETLASLVENRPPPALRALLEADDDLAERLDYKARHARFLLSLREDFLHLLERWRRSMPSLMENRLELRMLSGPQALEAVVRPGRLRVGLPEIIPDAVGQAVVRFVAGAGPDVPLDEIDAVPPLLSLVCAELNAQRLDSGEPQITQAQFEGHSSDILASYYFRSFELTAYGSAFDGIAHAGEVLKHLRCLIEDRLLSADGFRESIAFDTITRDLSRAAEPAGARVALEALVERRLLTVEERGGVRRIELAHDVLTQIVKTSRDERLELEAVSRARSEQQRAESETARILKERNRLQRQAFVATCLAVAAIAGALVGWIGFRRSKEATVAAVAAKNQAEDAERQAVHARDDAEQSEKQAIIAKDQAQAGFEAAWKGLSTLYDDYAAGTLENTPGISSRQANILKSKLRKHLLQQLRELNQEQPEHGGTIQYIARLLLDEGREAIADNDYSRAEETLAEALKWSTSRPLDSAPQAELYAEILLEQPRVPSNSGDIKRSLELTAMHLGKIRQLASQWPDSWRLEYLVIRLENVAIFDDASQPQEASQRLAARLIPLLEKSAQHFDPEVWYFVIEANGFRAPDGFDRTPAVYTSAVNLAAWFREHLVQGNRYTLDQLQAATDYFGDFVLLINTQFSLPNDESTKEARRSLLNEFETTMTAIESRLPRSTVVYRIRGDLLRLQEIGVNDGINTRSADELRAAAEKHRIAASALGVASSVAESINPAFKSYIAEGADEATRASAVATVQSSLRDFVSLDLAGVDTVLQSYEITTAAEKLRAGEPTDPLLVLHHQIVEHYIRLYAQANRDAKSQFIETFSKATYATVEGWARRGEYEKIADFWQQCYQGLPIATLKSGEKSLLVFQLNRSVGALLRTGRRDEAHELLNEALALCDAILEERPWEWYVKGAYAELCFNLAAVLTEIGEPAMVQPILRRAWRAELKYFGKEELLDRYPELPLRGNTPDAASADDAAFFASFATGSDPKLSLLSRLTVPYEFAGTKYQFFVSVYSGSNGYQELLEQFRWLKEMRGGIVPAEMQDRFALAHKIAVENNVDFRDLAVSAIGTADTPETRLDTAIEELKKAEAEYSKDESDTNRRNLAAACTAAANRALYRERWTDSEAWARKSIELGGPPSTGAYGNLATALLFQGKYDQALEIYRAHWEEPFDDKTPGDSALAKALEIYRAHWEKPLNGKTLGDSALADFEALAKAEITHPDVARIKAELGGK